MILQDWKRLKDERPDINRDEVGLLALPIGGDFPSTCHYDGRFWFRGRVITDVEYWTYLPPLPKNRSLNV